MLDAARQSLERQFQAMAVGGSAPDIGTSGAIRRHNQTAEEVLEEALSWFAVHFGRVHRVLASRQRRVVEPSSEAEKVYATFWREAALLASEAAAEGRGKAGGAAEATEVVGDGAVGDAAIVDVVATSTTVLQQPSDPFACLIVLPGLAVEDPLEFRNVLRSLTLSLVLLGLAEDFNLSGFHPRDTFQVVTAEDGSRSWEMQLAHPLIHVVRKK